MNLLTDRMLTVQSGLEPRLASLPELLAMLGDETLDSLLRLQRHQEEAWHVFMCYLAAAILVREGVNDPAQSEKFWRDGMRRLAAHDGCNDDDAWRLVVTDFTKPAFMQPALAANVDTSKFKLKAETPDALDVLPTAKNHDVKSRRVSRARSEDWVYALVSLQTMSGYFGNGNYGIFRMNSGSGSRPVVGVYCGVQPARRWKQDVERLLLIRKELLSGEWSYDHDGLVLCWIPEWDLQHGLSLSKLDPFFIEVSRAIRNHGSSDAIAVDQLRTSGPRVDGNQAKGLNGRCGDPWTPVNVAKQAALTVPGTGLSATLLRNLIFEHEYMASAMQRLRVASGSECDAFHAAVLVRGQGTTEGFHEAEIPIPPRVRSLFGSQGPAWTGLADVSKDMMNDAGTMQNRVLKPAVFMLLQGGADTISFDKREIAAWWKNVATSFQSAWEPAYFACLWSTVELGAEGCRHQWQRDLHGWARGSLEGAIERFPTRSGRRYRARVRAEGFFNALLFKNFPDLKESCDG